MRKTFQYSKWCLPAALILITACGPIYDTSYVLTPPKTSAGSDCVSECRYHESTCKRWVRDRYERCQEYNREESRDCSDRIRREKNRNPKWTECGNVEACDSSESTCEAEYRDCFQSCGGKVEEVKRCIMNCEEVPKPSPPPAVAPKKAPKHKKVDY